MATTTTNDEGRIEADIDQDQRGTVALYCRVSTEDQSLARQRQRTNEYATDRLGIEPPLSKCIPTSKRERTLGARDTAS